jgi:hypothetical protein
MNAQSKPVSLLFNPSVYLAGAPALFLGLAAILLAGLLGSLGNVHFDGVLDTHVGAPVPLWVFLLEGILDWLSLGFVLLVLGRIISRTAFRSVDVLGTQALARWPTVLMSVVLLPPAVQRFSNNLVLQLRAGGTPKINPADAFVFIVAVVAVLVFLCWMIALMYRAFSVSCNVKGAKAIGTFIGGLLLAEIISKICLALVFQCALVSHVSAAASPASPPASDLTNLGAQFVDLLATKHFADAETQFDSVMKTAMPEATLRAVWEDLLTKAGPYQKELRSRVEKQAGYDVVLVTCQFQNQSLDLKVVYDSQQHVTGLWILPPSKQ